MGLETVTYIDDLVITNPVATDDKSQGDDHIRNIKKAIKASFPGVDGAVTSTDSELNILDGVTSTAAELNILDGVTSTAAELNILDGVTSTAAELNILDGVTSTAAELNAVDGITAVVGDLNVLSRSAATQGDILYYGSSGVPAKLGFGTAGKSLITGGTGANPSWSSIPTGTLTAGNVLTMDPYAINTQASQPHGLGAMPIFWTSILVCKTAEYGYEIGEQIHLGGGHAGAAAATGFSIIADATTTKISTTALGPIIIREESPLSASNITVAYWKLLVTPYRLN